MNSKKNDNFSENELLLLKLYVEKVEELKKCKGLDLLKKKLELEIEASVKNKTLKYNMKIPDEELIKSFLLTFRQFYNPKDKLEFFKVHKIIYKKTKDLKYKEYLKNNSKFYKKAKEPFMKLIVNNKLYKTDDIIKLIFYSGLFHTDVERYKELGILKGIPANGFLYYIFFNSILDLIKQIEWLSYFIQKTISFSISIP